MYEQPGLLSFKVRYLLAVLFVAAFFIAISATVTAIGSGTILSKSHQTASASYSSLDSSPDALTAGASQLAQNSENAILSAGSNIYGVCRSVTNGTRQSGKYYRGSRQRCHL